jgi:hypothetical protein
MNKIEIKDWCTATGLPGRSFFIDCRPLCEYINEWIAPHTDLWRAIAPADGLAICWTPDYYYKGDADFMRFVLNRDHAITPILSCPDDFDFSCIVIVAEVFKNNDTVIWRRIGKVDHAAESFEQEKLSGILCVEAYSEEDRARYGDTIALEKVDSPLWRKWIGENWDEELYRRRVNYTFPYYQNQENVRWFAACHFEFDKREYDALVESCYE